MAGLAGLFGPGKKIEGLIGKGEAALQKREHAAARGQFEQAKELIEKHKGTKETDALAVTVYLGLGRALLGEGRRDELFQYLDRAFEFEGDKKALLEFVGATYNPADIEKEGMGQSAYRVYKQAYGLAPGNEKILMGFAYGIATFKDYIPDNTKALERAWRANRDAKRVKTGLGEALLQSGATDEFALGLFRELIKLEPDNEDYRFALARAYCSMELPPGDAFSVIQWARKLRPEDPLFFEGLTKIYLQSDEMLESIFEHLLESYNRKPTDKIAQRLLPYLVRAKDTSEFAVEIYERFWKQHERREQILYLLGEVYLKAKRSDAPAREVYEAVYELNPGAMENTRFLAALYAKDNRQDADALKVYEMALAEGIARGPLDVVKCLAKGYVKGGRNDARAREVYFQHVANMPQDHEVLKILGDIALSKKALDERDLDVLEKLFKLPVTDKAGKVQIAKLLAEQYTPKARKDEIGINVYRFLWKEEPDALTPTGVHLLAHHVAALEKPEPYIPLLQKALETRFDAVIGGALAAAYLAKGRLDAEALGHYLRVLREDPSNEAILSFVTPKILESADPEPQYYPLILGALESHPKSVLDRLTGAKGRAILIKMARHWIERARYRSAQVVLESATRTFKGDAEIDYLLAVVLAAQGKSNESYAILQHLAKATSTPLIQYRLGHIALLSGKSQEAAKTFEALAGSFPNHPLLSARRGQLAEISGDVSTAKGHYKALATSQTAYAPYGALKLAMLDGLTNGNATDAAIGTLTQDPIFGAQAQSLLAYRHFKLGREAFDRNDHRTAAREWEQALAEKAAANQEAPALRAALAEALFRLGVAAFTKGEHTQAEAHLKKAWQTDPDHGAAALFEGVACHASGKLIKAKACYERVLDAYPALHAEVALLYGRLELHKKQYSLANDLFEGAMESPYRPQALLGRAISYYLNGQEEKLPPILSGNALMEVYEAGLLDPGLLGVIYFRADKAKEGAKILERVVQQATAEGKVPFDGLFILGLLYVASGQRNLAFHHWQQLVNLTPEEIVRRAEERGIPKSKMIELYYNLLYRFLSNQQVDPATALLHKLEKLDPEGPDLATARSYIELEKGYLAALEKAYSKATNHWKDALKHAPNLSAYQNLGLVEMIKGHPEPALRYWKTFFEILERKVKTAPDENEVIQLNEARRIVNLLTTFQEEEEFKAAVKKQILIDDIEAVNQHYMTLGLSKGANMQEAEKSYFRLIRTYNPERYPKEFMVIEEAYGFFNDKTRQRKAEILVFNAFDLHRALRNSRLPFQWGLPELPGIQRQIEAYVGLDGVGKVVKPTSHSQKLDMDAVDAALEVKEIALVDYLAEW